jgi:hypothetical protein
MMSVLNTPYPKSTVLKFTKFLAGISFMVAFILIVLQPFGTASFSHPYKYGILAGYGIVIYVSGSLFFSFIDHFLSDAIKDKWTVGYEIGLLFCTILISQTSCYLYWVWLFGSGISIMAFSQLLDYSYFGLHLACWILFAVYLSKIQRCSPCTID